MEPKKGYASAQAESGDDLAKSAQIETENKNTEFSNAVAEPSESAFTKAQFYKRLNKMEADLLLHAEAFKNVGPIAQHIFAAKMGVLKDMGGNVPTDDESPPKQGALPLDAPSVVEETHKPGEIPLDTQK